MKRLLTILLLTFSLGARAQQKSNLNIGFVDHLPYSIIFKAELDTSYKIIDTSYSAVNNIAYMSIRYHSNSTTRDAINKLFFNGKYWLFCQFELLPPQKSLTLNTYFLKNN